MKKIIIVNNNMKVGGVQKSLYNLLWSLEGLADVTLLLFSKNGAYLQQLPPWVKVVECESLFRYLGISQGECRGADRAKRGALAAACRFVGRHRVMKWLLRSRKMLPEEYDCAIAFLHNGNDKNFYGGVQEFVLHRIKAHKKVAYLHCDYGSCGANHPANNELIAKFDAIAACSQGCRQAFTAVLPEMDEKSVTVRNCHRIQEIQRLAAAEPVVYDDNAVNIVMVSRLAHEKAIDRAIVAVAGLTEKNVALHIVGGGPMEASLRQLAEEKGIAHRVHFYGEQSNPYRYMKCADLFLLTSYHEAAPMVIEEARCLHLPVLTVRTTSSEEMVTEQGSGWVCENDQQALNEMLRQILQDPNELKQKKMRMQSAAVDNEQALSQFMNLIEG